MRECPTLRLCQLPAPTLAPFAPNPGSYPEEGVQGLPGARVQVCSSEANEHPAEGAAPSRPYPGLRRGARLEGDRRTLLVAGCQRLRLARPCRALVCAAGRVPNPTPHASGHAAADDERRQGAVQRAQRAGADQLLRRIPRPRQRPGGSQPDARLCDCWARPPRLVCMRSGRVASRGHRSTDWAPCPLPQISIVLEYMDGGSLADVLRKVGDGNRAAQGKGGARQHYGPGCLQACRSKPECSSCLSCSSAGGAHIGGRHVAHHGACAAGAGLPPQKTPGALVRVAPVEEGASGLTMVRRARLQGRLLRLGPVAWRAVQHLCNPLLAGASRHQGALVRLPGTWEGDGNHHSNGKGCSCTSGHAAPAHSLHPPPQPANILLNLQGDAKIADFGISAVVDNTVANVGGARKRQALLGEEGARGEGVGGEDNGERRPSVERPTTRRATSRPRAPVPDVHGHCDLHVARAHRGPALQLPCRHMVGGLVALPPACVACRAAPCCLQRAAHPACGSPNAHWRPRPPAPSPRRVPGAWASCWWRPRWGATPTTLARGPWSS